MNKTSFPNVFLALLFTLTATQGCAKGNSKTGIYQLGRTWEFTIFNYDSLQNLTDSCNLEMQIKKGNLISFIAGQKNLTYTYNCCGKSYKETTGAKEKEGWVGIHPPRMGCLAFTEVPPMPEISEPVEIGNTFTTELVIQKSTFKPVSGMTIKQELKAVGTDTLFLSGKSIPCFVFKGKNLNHIQELGQYKCTYWFNTTYGFVRLLYKKPDGTAVDMKLKKVTF